MEAILAMELINRSFFKRKEVKYTKLPEHIAIIMDGNGRWAKKRGMTRGFGHKQGCVTLKKIVKYCSKIGIKYLTVYAFSTENWRRPKSEVDQLMSLLREYLIIADEELKDSDVRLNVIGDIASLEADIQKEIHRIMEKTKERKGMVYNIALNYGGRNEIIMAVRSLASKVANGELGADEIDEELVAQNLYTQGMPDPDLIIRTSGEQRISNFLIWQSAYSEFWFPEVLWPDFKTEDIDKAIMAFQNRDRRFGGA